MNFGDKEFHIHLSKKDSARYAITPGDPGRVEKIAKLLDQPRFEQRNREFTTFSGYLKGEKVLVTSTGIGGPSAAIAIEELHHIGVDTVIRVGTCGGIASETNSGDLIIATSAVKMDGTSNEYAPTEFPAVANFEIVEALKNSAEKNSAKYHVGTVQSKDAFYGQHNPNEMPTKDVLNSKWQAWKKLSVLGSEMECAAIMTVAAARKIRAGAVLLCMWNQDNPHSEQYSDTTYAIKTAIDAMSELIEKDKLKSKINK